MKKSLILFLFLPLFAFGQTFNGHAKVQIRKGLAVNEKAELDFGELVVSGEGNIVITPAGVPTITGNITQSGLTSVGVLGLTGMPNAGFVLSLPTTATIYNGSASLYVTEFKSNFATGVGTLDANGVANISLGAKLSVPINYIFGYYSGTYSIVVSYQ